MGRGGDCLFTHRIPPPPFNHMIQSHHNRQRAALWHGVADERIHGLPPHRLLRLLPRRHAQPPRPPAPHAAHGLGRAVRGGCVYLFVGWFVCVSIDPPGNQATIDHHHLTQLLHTTQHRSWRRASRTRGWRRSGPPSSARCPWSTRWCVRPSVCRYIDRRRSTTHLKTKPITIVDGASVPSVCR